MQMNTTGQFGPIEHRCNKQLSYCRDTALQVGQFWPKAEDDILQILSSTIFT